MQKLHRLVLALACAAVPWQLHAADEHAAHHPSAASAPSSAPAADFTDGEVRKIDSANAKLTVRHAEIKSLDMPAMTMVFGVRDKALLDGLKPGDKVRFKAVDEGGGKLVITELKR